MKKVSLVLVLVMLGIFIYASSGLPTVGDPGSAPAKHVSPRYIAKSFEETDSPNFVTATLADYRGYDTLGETTVIFIAGLATVLILRANGNTAKNKRGGGKK